MTAIAVVLGLTGCQTLNEEQCLTTDWRQLGETDGNAGRQQSYIARHQEACNKFGAAVDVAAWHAGWDLGIRYHCTPENGLDRGLNGSGASQACPADLAFDYRQAHKVGSELHSARSAVERQRDELDDTMDALAEATVDTIADRRRDVEVKRKELKAAENRLDAAERAVELFRSRLMARR
ncbi:DUF2799 domain-containing protein [Oricola sp.]|uniref:DUF2799 domain-containing protein n=1 Tax=Oricola sp. TaxID=1979950 RepID=UPI0025DEDD88|nr:DUF2799 domain-containing protein [Oricola sp.]MCI5077375.1 DUF2799 domain-containing protein [Oricola sp.]